MCELFGFDGNKKRQLNTELTEFFSHAPDNPNGWGMALFEGGSIHMNKEDIRADESAFLKERLKSPIRAQNAIAHIRLATIGVDEYENTHPFIGEDISQRRWTLAHNGTIFESGALSPYIHRQKGRTDSERILLYILDRMNDRIKSKGAALNEEERFSVIDSVIVENSPKNKLNLLIYDGEILYVHTNCRGSLYFCNNPEGVSFSTKPLSEGKWENVALTTPLAYSNGRRIMTGTNHGNEYIPDEESIRALYLAYSGL